MITNQLSDLSMLYRAVEKLTLPVSIWAGKGKNTHLVSPILAISNILAHIFLSQSTFLSLLIFPSCTMFNHSQCQLSECTAGLFAVITIKLSERTKRQKKNPLLFSHFLWVFFPTYWLWCLHGFHKQCHLKGVSETHSGKWIAIQWQRFWRVSLSFGKRSNTTPTQIKKKVQVGSNVPQRRGATSCTAHTCSRTHTHRNTGTTGVLCVGWVPTQL